MYENLTVEEVKNDILSRITTDIDLREGSFFNDMISAAAYKIWQNYQSLDALFPIAYVDETSGEYIDKRCAEYAIFRKTDETDASLVTRLYNYLQNPSSSGNVNHYKQWALEVDGVGSAKVVPLWNGPGTVKVLIIGSDKKPVDTTIVTNCTQHIEANRPIGATVTVESASGLNINVSATITVNSSTTKALVQEAFKTALNSYLLSIAFDTYTVVYNRIAYILLDITGVVDYSSLLINGGTANITVGANQVPVAGTVVIS